MCLEEWVPQGQIGGWLSRAGFSLHSGGNRGSEETSARGAVLEGGVKQSMFSCFSYPPNAVCLVLCGSGGSSSLILVFWNSQWCLVLE